MMFPQPTSLPFVRSLAHRVEVDSTSDLARELVQTGGFETPLLVWADRQSKGRGQGNNAWWSDEGSLTFTLAFDPLDHGFNRPGPIAAVGLIAALAVIEAVESLLRGVALEMRWPNDVEHAGRKLGGILPEHIETREGRRLLIGVGLNVSSNLRHAPDVVRSLAVSLADLTDNPPSPEEILPAILVTFEQIVELLKHDSMSVLARRWQARDSLKDMPVRLLVGANTIAGIGRGIDDRGALLVESDGVVSHYFGGRVLREPFAAASDGLT